MQDLPLVVDLDGTLIEGDVSLLSVWGLLRRSPLLTLALLPLFLVHRARFKHEIALRYVPDAAALRYIPAVLSYVRAAKEQGRTVVLATASNVAIARAVALYLGCFDDVIGSDARTYRGGTGKARALVERFGPRGFVYAGNEWRDLPVWRAAAAAIPVRVSPTLLSYVRSHFTVECTF